MTTQRAKSLTFPPRALGALAAAPILFAALATASGQPAGCKPSADLRDAPVLRCGEGLTIRAAPNTRYQLIDQTGDPQPGGARLDSGALMIDFKPGNARRKFQILTPHAVAAVRGTMWAVDVVPERTSTLVLTGTVAVTRAGGGPAALLRAGEGVDVEAGAGPIVVKRWAKQRVDALLARFRQ